MKTNLILNLGLATFMLYSCSTTNNDDLNAIIEQEAIKKTDSTINAVADSINLVGRLKDPLFLEMQRWATHQGDFWDTQKWLIGDFNGDGKSDYAKAWNSNWLANIDAHLSTGSSFRMERWATQQGGYWDSQKWMAGDFNGDGKTDLAKVFNHDGFASLDAHLSTGSSFYMERWQTKEVGFWEKQKWISGDFNGDGKTDLANVWNLNGLAYIDVHLSTGSSFRMQRWANGQGNHWDSQKWMCGDFNGDGKDDLVKTWNSNGLANIDVHLSTGSSFRMERWATQQGGYWEEQVWMVCDYNGDGYSDLAKVFPNGLKDPWASIDVHPSNGQRFGFSRIATRQGGFWYQQKWGAGDFDGDGRDDFSKVFDYYGAAIEVHLSKIF